MDDPAGELAQLLRTPLPPSVAALDDATLTALHEAVVDARDGLAADLRASLDQAMRHIPLPLRGPIRKALGV